MGYYQQYPGTRLRRQRKHAFIRELCKETSLQVSDLIYPVFVTAGDNKKQAIDSMPGQYRYSVDQLLHVAESCAEKSIPAVALFPSIDKEAKSLDAKEALNSQGLVPTAIRELKKRFPDLGIVADVALDPYTSHGQDGITNEMGYILNDETVTILQQQSLCLAEAGADIVAPSDMMDGRIGAIRKSLEENNFKETMILAYTAKYASSFYGPFRDAVQSKQNLGQADKTTYQLAPCNIKEAILEAEMDISEGADMIMVKPGQPYLDVISTLRATFANPVWAYQVSGEYAMLTAAAQNGWLDLKKCAMESLIGFKRAGAGAILSYFALEAADWIRDH